MGSVSGGHFGRVQGKDGDNAHFYTCLPRSLVKIGPVWSPRLASYGLGLQGDRSCQHSWGLGRHRQANATGIYAI